MKLREARTPAEVQQVSKAPKRKAHLKSIRRGIASAGAAAMMVISIAGCASQNISYQLLQGENSIYSATHDPAAVKYFDTAVQKQGVSAAKIGALASGAISAYRKDDKVDCLSLFAGRTYENETAGMTQQQRRLLCPEENEVYYINQSIFGNGVFTDGIKSKLDSQPPSVAAQTLQNYKSPLYYIEHIGAGLAILAVVALGAFELRYRRERH